jgi:hypothetical protein
MSEYVKLIERNDNGMVKMHISTSETTGMDIEWNEQTVYEILRAMWGVENNETQGVFFKSGAAVVSKEYVDRIMERFFNRDAVNERNTLLKKINAIKAIIK